MEILYLSQQDVIEVAPPMEEMIDLLETAFREKGQGRTEMPPKLDIHPRENCFIHAMPAVIPALGAVGVKWISGFPTNRDRDLPYITGLLILNDPETGVPVAVMDAAWITAERTGAATALAARYLARGNASVLAVLGCGVQGRSNLRALRCVCPNLSEVRAYDVHPDRTEAYILEMSHACPGLDFVAATSPRETVRDADIIVTAGPILSDPRPVIEAGWLKPGCFVCPLDYGSYVKAEVFRKADKFLTDDAEQILSPRSACYFPDMPPLYGDLGEVVAGLKSGRESDTERIVCANLGLAIDDMAVGSEVFRRARVTGHGRILPL
ncbi:MAG TPA: ornithine cyclodeaminase family protein [Candidatus Polarisedimenticolia bacterium]|nr:ornithine cyclodeaminase family protein [Candidatus Polarisedimenticolia bacterium]